MELQYKLESFEGPLDLLLHLIEKNKVNIYNQMLSGVVRSIDELASESQKYLLENEKFGVYIIHCTERRIY